MFSFSMKSQLEVSFHPVGCCSLHAVRGVGVENHGHTYECPALYDGMRGHLYSSHLGGGMRGGKTSALLLAEKNCSLNRAFQTFIDWCFLFFFVELIHIKVQRGAGKVLA